MAVAAPPQTDRSHLLLAAVFSAVVGGFLVTLWLGQRASAEVDRLEDRIVFESTPSIQRLASVRASTWMTRLALSNYLSAPPPQRTETAARLDLALETLNTELRSYLVRPEGQAPPMWEQLHPALVRFEEQVHATRRLSAAGRAPEAQAQLASQVDPSAQRLVTVATQGVERHALQVRLLGAQIKESRHRARWVSGGMTSLCVALGIGGAWLLRRQSRRQRQLADDYEAFLQARSEELEQFAGRMAHDIRNPLSAAKTGAELLRRRSDDPKVQELAGRIIRSLGRANAITSGLLEFARAGARPDPGARTDLRELLADFAGGMSGEAEAARIQLVLEPIPPVLVACNPGVYLSLVGNLVRNGIKYMGEGPQRTIRIQVLEEGRRVKTVVSDTGPGIRAADLPTLFEPYFRAAGASAQPGLGLGLATVKKLAEGHGGAVGVVSNVGQGTTLWFSLPLAGTVRPESALPDPQHRPLH